MIDKEICKGCRTYIEERICEVNYKVGSEFCVCSTCLVKGMCTEPCEDWLDYRSRSMYMGVQGI